MQCLNRTQASGLKNRRNFFIAAAALALASVAAPASATNWWTATPTVSIGTTVLNVKNFGAMGNGVTDDTAAFQAAVNALPSTGGTIVVPTGNYMINALTGINLRSHTRLSLWGTAYLKAIPNNATRYWIVKAWNVNNVEIVGGNYVGERTQHQGTTGEWGYLINIEGSSNVYVHDTSLSNSWGDGILVGGTGWGRTVVVSTNVTLNRVKSTNNRRQGLTIAPSNQVYVVNSSFTNSNGTLPQSGIDIEPQTQGVTQNVRLENTTVSGNVGNGLEVHDYVSGLTLSGFTALNNQGFGAYVNGANGVVITKSNLSQNYLFGVDIAGYTNNVQLTSNTIEWNGDTWFYAHSQSIFSAGWALRDITIASTATNVTQTSNLISPMK
ncbi:right-handed parallel beta-helix repeat-containing protein [Dyella sp. 2HG41-7]|uniref:right-handed parallel beta-helix repeat-containing protein n=1 Tax=Dyella sp. 2HG41-7 TaxID=2883239 RepID=UPI001F3F574A|nr:right-handed parallel beta-helix repeat-containing protein [Dyella sp. 2HG41-7]